MFGSKSTKITKIHAEEILDSRGNPTLRVVAETLNNKASFEVPSGASTGAHEAHELRDGGKRFSGKGVLKAVENINTIIAREIIEMNAEDQEKIDRQLINLDGTNNKSKLGGNAIIGTSLAVAKLAAMEDSLELFEYLIKKYKTKDFAGMPLFYMNMINGGMHSESKIAFQEYMIVPKINSAETSVEIGHDFQKALKKTIKTKLDMTAIGVGDEGGFVIDKGGVETPLEIFLTVAKELGIANKIDFALDVAANSFYKDGNYIVDGKKMSSDEMFGLYEKLISKYPLLSIEGPFYEEAFQDFARLNQKCDIVVGDDITVTNKDLLQKAIDKKAIDAVIIKPNQIGTLTEVIEAINLARDNGIKCIASHRSGETMDTFISDLAYAFGCFGLKAGALQRGERVAKYNRLLEIERLVS